jgi:peptide/nickel transport system permease protein
MAVETNIGQPFISETPPRIGEWKRFRRVFFKRKIVTFGLIIILIFVVAAIFAPFLTPYDPNLINLSNSLLQPSWTHPLGTDQVGRDALSRIIYGTRVSLFIGLVVVSIACVIGMVLGVIAGYFGGWTFTIIMRFIDSLMAFPMVILALVVAALLGGGARNVIIALSIPMIPAYARLMCGQVLSIRENDYVVAERSIGSSHLRILWLHIIPNCLQPFIVLVTMMLGSVILAEAGLSFLGVGITPPTATWGNMVNDGRPYLLTNPILSFSPGFTLILVVFAFNMVGDGLRDALDPRLRGLL